VSIGWKNLGWESEGAPAPKVNYRIQVDLEGDRLLPKDRKVVLVEVDSDTGLVELAPLGDMQAAVLTSSGFARDVAKKFRSGPSTKPSDELAAALLQAVGILSSEVAKLRADVAELRARARLGAP